MHEDLALLMEPVARRLLGEPNKALSHGHNFRFGNRGSLSVDTKQGVWHDHERGEGGGVLALIRRERGLTNGYALEWLRAEDFDVPDRNDAPRGAERRPFAERIVCTYDYRDKSGELLFQVVRLRDPKTFRQRRPDPSCRDGWSWKLGDTRRVLYRLPELLEAAEDAIVFVVEGEKDVDRLRSLGLHATTSPEGLPRIVPDPDTSEQFRTLHVGRQGLPSGEPLVARQRDFVVGPRTAEDDGATAEILDKALDRPEILVRPEG